MKSKARVIFEISDKKLRDAAKNKASKEGRTLKYILESLLKKYIEKGIDLQ